MIENSDIWDDKVISKCISMSTKLEGMPSNLTTADDFTGKKVIDREGIQYGKVKHIHINQDTLRVSGVTIHQGFNKDYFLSETYIDKFTDNMLLLSTPPITVGSLVVDIDGNKLGKIKRLHRSTETNDLESIEVSNGLFNTKILGKSEIWGVGEKVILSLKKEQFKNLE